MTKSDLIDIPAHRRHRERAAANFSDHQFLKNEVAARLTEKILSIKRRFPMMLDLGCHHGEVAKAMIKTGKIDRVIAADPSWAMASYAAQDFPALVADYDALPFPRQMFDAIVSGFSFHWIEDLPLVLTHLCQMLKPDGILLVALAGGDSLKGLRAVLAAAESETTGGISPRVLPMADIRGLGGVLMRAGFALPVVDSETITITWDDIFAMTRELKAMGEANALTERSKRFTRREVFIRAEKIYRERFSDEDGRIRADIDLVTLTGWAPAENQQKPLLPGSGKIALADALASPLKKDQSQS